jgi:hypothetical protein
MGLVDTYRFHDLEFQVFQETSATGNHPKVPITPPIVVVPESDYSYLESVKILGGGAHTNYPDDAAGSLLTAMYPEPVDDTDESPEDACGGAITRWWAKAKDHVDDCPATVTAHCIAIKGIPDEFYCCSWRTSARHPYPAVRATLPPGFVLVGGGHGYGGRRTSVPATRRMSRITAVLFCLRLLRRPASRRGMHKQRKARLHSRRV